MPEMLAVVVMIGIFAAVAVPTFVNLLRDRRVMDFALQLSDAYRLARSRAIGRGGMTLVNWNSTAGLQNAGSPLYAGHGGVVEVREAIVGPSGDNIVEPALGCQIDWSAASVVSRHIAQVDFGNGYYELGQAVLSDGLGSTPSYYDVCFSPRGHTWYRETVGATFTQLLNVPSYTVTNLKTLTLRTVFIPPNGNARIAL
jgi:type II secretory pathway pseudopilin PulG